MQSYVAKIRLNGGGHEYVKLDAASTLEARAAAMNACVRRGLVIAVIAAPDDVDRGSKEALEAAFTPTAARQRAHERIAARHAAVVAAAALSAKVSKMRRDGLFKVMLLAARMPLVRCGGDALCDLREDVFDEADRINARAGVHGISEIYASALMGGEPFAVWN